MTNRELKRLWWKMSAPMKCAVMDHPAAKYDPRTIEALQRRGLLDEHEDLTPKAHELRAWVGRLAS